MTRSRILLASALCALAIASAPFLGCASPELATGERAPDFELLADDGRPVRLYDVLSSGKNAVLYFYAQDDTPG